MNAVSPVATLRRFWSAMEANDFFAAAQCLSEDCLIHWPQSAEIIRGRAGFIAVNAAYPVTGRWSVVLHSLISQGCLVVTDVTIHDQVQAARCIGFYDVHEGFIRNATEWWPDPMPVPDWRRGLTEVGT